MGYEISVVETDPPSFAPSWWDDEDVTRVVYYLSGSNPIQVDKENVTFSSIGVSLLLDADDGSGKWFIPWSAVTRLTKN